MNSLSTVLHLNKNEEVYMKQASKAKLRDAPKHRFTQFVGYLLNQDVSFGCLGKKSVYTNGKMTYGTVKINLGNGLTASTGIFTAPVSGNYAFHLHGLHYSDGNEYSKISFRLNNEQVSGTYVNIKVSTHTAYYYPRLICILAAMTYYLITGNPLSNDSNISCFAIGGKR